MSLKNPYRPGGMFEGASHLIFENAKRLRRNMTNAETVLWMRLKKGIEGLKIRRQHPIGIYIADFYCHKVKLIIEVDGSIHDNTEVKENDRRRQLELENWGYHLLRFTNHQALNEEDEVIKKITNEVTRLLDLSRNK